jgi:hypothetical protein
MHTHTQTHIQELLERERADVAAVTLTIADNPVILEDKDERRRVQETLLSDLHRYICVRK